MPWLKMLRGEITGRMFPLNNEVTVLGRDAACEIVLSDQGVSKRHAKIIRKGDGFFIEDLHSTNGTRVGDECLTESRLLEDGDLIEVGGTQFAFAQGDSMILSVLDVSSQTDPQIIRI